MTSAKILNEMRSTDNQSNMNSLFIELKLDLYFILYLATVNETQYLYNLIIYSLV